MMIDTIRWKSESPNSIPGVLRLIDQRQLPQKLDYLELNDVDAVVEAIYTLAVRGAPAIGIAGAFGLVIAAQQHLDAPPEEFKKQLNSAAEKLARSRPTAVNLTWAIKRCMTVLNQSAPATNNDAALLLLREAQEILDEDIAMCRKIGRHGLELLKNGATVLTHCNAGALATGDFGTALAPIYTAAEQQITVRVYADETRPLLQGARLTAWELNRAGIDVTVICDNMAAQVMREKRIDLVIVGADRIAANGDVANKIGTYGLAILASWHQIPFYVAAPYSTLDPAIKTGAAIPIEQRNPHEISHGFNRQTAPDAVSFYNPAFDVTPATLISGIITERGILRPPFHFS